MPMKLRDHARGRAAPTSSAVSEALLATRSTGTAASPTMPTGHQKSVGDIDSGTVPLSLNHTRQPGVQLLPARPHQIGVHRRLHQHVTQTLATRPTPLLLDKLCIHARLKR